MRTARFVVWTLFAFTLGAQSARAASTPLDLYGAEIKFDVERKGRVIGSHTVRFQQTGGGLETRSDVNMAVDALFFRAYRYRYTSTAIWRDAMLDRLAVDIDDNGKRSRMTARREGDRLAIALGSFSFASDGRLHPTEHWNVDILAQRQVLNTLTGKINHVVIQRGPRDIVTTERGPVSATLYRYTGDLAAEVWYDDAGRWVKMRFKGHDGSTIGYRCRRCQGSGANP